MTKKGRTGNKYRKVKISHEQVKKQNKKQYAKIAFLALFLLIVTIGGSYAIFQTTISGKKTTEIVSGTLTIEYLDKNEINLNNAYPMSDEEGLNTIPYTFTIKNTGTLNGKYTISLEEKKGNTLDKNYIKYAIREKDGEWSNPTLLSSGLILKENVIIESGKDTTYELKMWLDNDAPNEVQGKTYSGKIVVDTVQTNATPVVTSNPIIELNGEKVITLDENESYVEVGVSSINSREELRIEDITTRYEFYDGNETTTVDSIDTSKVGIYYIYYEIEDSKGNIGITSRVVNVKKKDTNPPIITLKGESLISLDYGEEYIEPGYVASDVEDIDLTDKVVVIGTVNKEIAGVYVIKYIVIDSSGNTTSTVREVIVNKESNQSTISVTNTEKENLAAEIVINVTTESANMYYAVTTSNEKPSDKEYKDMEKVTTGEFTKVVEIVKNGTYYVYVKDEKNNIEVKKVEVTNIDETKPRCEFSEEEYVGKGKTVQIRISCTDPANITNENITKEYLETDEKIEIEIGESTKIENGYQYLIRVVGKQGGISQIKLLSNKISDTVGNKNESVIKEIKVTDLEVEQEEIKIDISKEKTKQIEVRGTNEGEIRYSSSNEEIVRVDESGLVTGIRPGKATISIEEGNGKVSKEVKVEVVKTLTIKYERGTGVESIGSTIDTCEVVDESGKCTIILPSISVQKGYTIDGWYEEETKVGNQLESIEVSSSKTYISKTVLNDYIITYDYNYLPNNIMESTYDMETVYPCCANTDQNSVQMNVDKYGKNYIFKNTIGNRGGYLNVRSSGLEVGKVYTWQLEVKASAATNMFIGSEQGGNPGLLTSRIETNWKRLTKTFTAVTNPTKAFIFYDWMEADTLQLRNIQMQEGNLNTKTAVLKYQATLGNSLVSPVRDGYTFEGWYTDPVNGTKIEQTTVVEDNATYYAHWSKNPYTVRYDYETNGGTASTKTSESVYPGGKIDLTPTATKSGYTFVGWNTSKDATVGLTDLNVGTSDVVLYAIYKKTVTWEFDKNGATSQTVKGGSASTAQTVTQSCTMYNTQTSCNITSPTINRSGYVIVGYNTGRESGTSAWNVNTQKAVSTSGKWFAVTKKSVTITFNKNGAAAQTDDGITAISEATLTKTCTMYNNQTSCNITTPTIIRNGYTIVGYNTSTTSQTSGWNVNTQKAVSANATWYAVTKKVVRITWSANGATIGSTADSCTIWNNATSCNIWSPEISRENYFIIGWNTNSSATTSSWDVGTVKSVSDSATYYAITELATAKNVIGSTTTLYRSLQEALSSASTTAATTTTLLKNTTENYVNIENPLKEATINLNGKTLYGLLINNNSATIIVTGNGKIEVSDRPAIINNNVNGKITINNGTFTYSNTSTSGYAPNIQNNGTIIINNGTFTHSLSSNSNNPNIINSKNMTINNGTFTASGANDNIVNSVGNMTINGGTFTATGSGSNIENTGTLNIKVGTFEANTSDSAIKNQSIVNMSGGTVIQNGSSHTVLNEGTFNMTGGSLKLTKQGTNATAFIQTENSAFVGTGGSIEATGNAFVNRGNTADISNMKITVTDSNGYYAVLQQGKGPVKLKNNTIKSSSSNYILYNLSSSYIESWNDAIDGKPFAGIIYRYYEWGSGEVEIDVFGRNSESIRFPTWTDKNGQDDIIWYNGSSYTSSLGTYQYVRIKSSSHNNEKGLYHTHIYSGSTNVHVFDYTMP